MPSDSSKKFERLVRKLGRLARQEADRGMSAPAPAGEATTQPNAQLWVSAYVDVRWFVGTNDWSAKYRIVLPGGQLHGSHPTKEMKYLFEEIWGVRNEDSSTQWYGLKVIVTPDGKITTELDTNPDCVVDPLWFKS